MREVLVVYNPAAGIKKIRNTKEIIQQFLRARDVAFTWLETQPDVALALAQYLMHPYERIIVVGGDGTAREVAGSLIARGSKIPLAIVAQGTANMLAGALGIPTFPLERALAFALDGPVQSFDAMLVNRAHYALIAAGQGYDAAIMLGATRALKRRWGIIAYVLSFLKVFFTFTTHQYSLVIDEERRVAVGKAAIACNMLAAGGLRLDREISPQDGLVQLVILNPRTLWDAVKMPLWWLRYRRLRRIPSVQIFSGKRISINQKKARHVQIDGEVYTMKNLQIEILPQAVRLACNQQFP